MKNIYKLVLCLCILLLFVSCKNVIAENSKANNIKQQTQINLQKNNIKYIRRNKELEVLYNYVKEIHNSISYGVGSNKCFFNDEIIKYGKGNCSHYSLMLARKLIVHGYKMEIIAIKTYNKRIHSVVQTCLKTTGEKILLDATTGIVYLNSLGKILENPSLCSKVIGKSSLSVYSDFSFWSTVRTIQYIPYLGQLPLENIKRVEGQPKSAFYPKPNGINASLDLNYYTYTATKVNFSSPISILLQFSKMDRISSIVIEPYDINDYPSKIGILCQNDGRKTKIFDRKVKLVRGLIVINFPYGVRCKGIQIIFSDFVGQKRLLIRDIEIYGK